VTDPAQPSPDAGEPNTGQYPYVDVLCDGLPDINPPGFVELEDPDGRSIRFGGWVDRGDGFFALRIPTVPADYEQLRNVRRSADPHMAAELRRWADQLDEDAARIKQSLPQGDGPGRARTHTDFADYGRVIQAEDTARELRARADELDPPI
jgi:hypothetical protein